MWKEVSSNKLVSDFNLTAAHFTLKWCIWFATDLLLWCFSPAHIRKLACVCCRGGQGGSCQCKSLPACHLAPAGVMLWHIGKWGGQVDKDFNRILKWVMVAFMCVIVTYPKVTAPKRHHPSPACLPHASFCLTDLLKLCLFVCSQSHFHLWSSRAWASVACRAALRRDRQGWLTCSETAHPH